LEELILSLFKLIAYKSCLHKLLILAHRSGLSELV